jgi:hypothetical protein
VADSGHNMAANRSQEMATPPGDNQIGQERLGTNGLQLCDNRGASLTVPAALTLLGAKLELAKQPDLPSHTLSVLLFCRVEKAVWGSGHHWRP